MEIYSDYNKYLQDQMTIFESYEGELYLQGIKDTIEYIFPDDNYKAKLLDFCCGDGTGSKLLYEKGFKVKAFDGNHRKIERARQNCPDVFFRTAEVNQACEIYQEHQFDYIYASHVFEHFLDPMKVLADCKKLLKPEGQIIIIVPYPNSECEGHPGSNKLRLNMRLWDVEVLMIEQDFKVKIEQHNFRESEIVIKLTIK